MESNNKLFFSLLAVLLCKSVICLENCPQPVDEPPKAAFGYELLEAKMDSLQFRFLELFVHVKELGELMVNNQRTIEQNQLESKNLMHVLEDRLAANVSLITGYSKQILDYQTICANHDDIRKDLLSLKPILSQSRKYSTVYIGAESLPSPMAITSSEEINTTSAGLSNDTFKTETRSSLVIIKSCKETNSTSTGLFNMSTTSGGEYFTVLCEMEKFEGGWLVIQHRFNGSVDFYRNWTEYRNGFGDVEGEFWLGLEKIHQFTKEGTWELVVEVEDFSDNYRYARYSEFAVGNEYEQYSLKKLGSYSGTAGDNLNFHKQMKFSTFDKDGRETCAEKYHGAWWYNTCYHSNLNGLYANKNEYKEIKWDNGKPSLSYTRMMIRQI